MFDPVRGREVEDVVAGAAGEPGVPDDPGVPAVDCGTVVVAPGEVVVVVAASTVMVPDMPTPPGPPWILQ